MCSAAQGLELQGNFLFGFRVSVSWGVRAGVSVVGFRAGLGFRVGLGFRGFEGRSRVLGFRVSEALGHPCQVRRKGPDLANQANAAWAIVTRRETRPGSAM